MIITTTKGPMDDSLLEKRVIESDEPDAFVTATEYWLDGELVHRGVHAALKSKGLFSPQAQGFNHG